MLCSYDMVVRMGLKYVYALNFQWHTAPEENVLDLK